MVGASGARAPLNERVIAVTGANRGIGAALARAFASAGAGVVVHARTDESARAAAAASGARAAIAGDLRDAGLAGRLVAAADEVAEGRGLDGLILNAGVLGEMGPLESADLDRFREVMEINVDAQLRLFVAALPRLIERRGVVIWMTSGVGRFGVPGYGAYCASKHAVEGLNRLAHAEYAERGLVSMAVAPGMVQTDMLRAALGVDDVSEYLEPSTVAAAFVRLVAAAPERRDELGGQSLDVMDF